MIAMHRKWFDELYDRVRCHEVWQAKTKVYVRDHVLRIMGLVLERNKRTGEYPNDPMQVVAMLDCSRVNLGRYLPTAERIIKLECMLSLSSGTLLLEFPTWLARTTAVLLTEIGWPTETSIESAALAYGHWASFFIWNKFPGDADQRANDALRRAYARTRDRFSDRDETREAILEVARRLEPFLAKMYCHRGLSPY